MPISNLLILLATGVGIGFLSGLLGIGGGIIMTPVQYWLYTSSGIDSDLAIKISFATTLAVILPTAASGVWQHQKQGGINWRTAIFMGIFTSIGSFLGASISAHLPGSALKIAFGAIAIVMAVRMLTLKISDVERPTRNDPWLLIAIAVPIGLITGILGIGGGILVVPALVFLLGYRMRNAAATSLAIMLFTSIGGIAGYVYNGLSAQGLPAYTIGYIYWPAWIALGITSVFTAKFGAIAAHRLPGRVLNYIFIALLFYISLDMLGVIGWIGSQV